MIRKSTLAVLGLLVLAYLPMSCRAFSWSKKINQNAGDSKPAASSRTNDDVLSHEEIDTLLLNQETLTNYAQRPDCFSRAAGLIRTRCGELDMDEDERVNAAISMTLCELATAKHYSTPFECAPFTVYSALSPPGPRSQGECVDALSRSAQFWSSYSGYLREVPQLCFAFRRWHDIDTAREIYRNITLEKSALIQFITAREKDTQRIMRTWENHLVNSQAIVVQMQTVTSSLDLDVKDLHLRLTKEFDNVLRTFVSATVDLEVRQADRENSLVRQTEASLFEILQRHTQGLQHVIPALEAAIINHVDSIFIQSRAHNQASLDLANEAHQRWARFTNGISDVTQSMTLLSATASGIVVIFNDSIQQAKIIRQIQHETSDSAIQLSDTIRHLTVTTQAELEKINGSATFIQEQLLLHNHRTSHWITQVLNIFLPGPAVSDYFNGPPVFRIFLTVVDCIGYLCRLALSGITAIMIICFSYQKYLPSFKFSANKPDLSLQNKASPDSCRISHPPPSSQPLYYLKTTQTASSIAPSRHQRIRDSRIPDRLLYPSA